ncbi:methyltransferase domain-containing protein [Geobacter sp. DSM 9736]|uniref:methyltransferase domain-containing protein n=1 Tax=Geobacter sp. DSM 9736 TaxID=1277350 RepID=UPI000B508376|nr:methyltransferase domain-containing protein [Geobacter sp. DSM 9736]SNB45981.1 Methyltransferase domain-containing protein [Geobacter sp. DSM 9736]
MLPTPKRRTERELLDLPHEAYAFEELEGSLKDISIVNRYLGDTLAVLKHLSAMTGGASGRMTLLDVGTGSADIPAAIAGWCRNRGVGIEITGIDNNPHTVGIARKKTGHIPEIRIAVADGLDLPYPDRSFDYVICCKTLHHFADEEAVQLIRETARVARRGYLILDLRRSWTACFLISILTRLFTRNRLTRNDGPLSVLRSYTPAELASLASCAGVPAFTIHREPFWLMVLRGEAV